MKNYAMKPKITRTELAFAIMDRKANAAKIQAELVDAGDAYTAALVAEYGTKAEQYRYGEHDSLAVRRAAARLAKAKLANLALVSGI